jgi:YHS domain-containing protein
MEVDPKQAADTVEFRGRQYAFCSIECAEKFTQNPEAYVGEHRWEENFSRPRGASRRGSRRFTQSGRDT